ncbi:MAG: ArnT family glycosyltransferase [Prochlorotrichaceae cyanobacterium]
MARIAPTSDLKPIANWQIWGIFLLVSLISRFPYFFQGDIDWDESTFILLGQSVLEGHLPYTDLLDVKPPLLWYSFATLIFLGGKTFLGVRALGAIVVATIAAFSYHVTRTFWDDKTGWIAGFSWIILINLAPGGQAVLSEHLALLFLGACFTRLAIVPQGWRGFLGAGILMGVAVLIRLNLAYTAVCLGLYLLLKWIISLRQEQAQPEGLALLAYSLGGLLPLIAIVLPYVLTQTLPVFYTGFIQASLSYTKQYNLLSVLWFQFQKVIFLRLSFVGIIFSIVIFWALGSHLRWFWQHRQRLTAQKRHFYSLIAFFILSIEFSILQTGAFYSHYTIQFLFFISILMAKPLQQLLRIGYQLKVGECGADRRTLPVKFFAFSEKPRTNTFLKVSPLASLLNFRATGFNTYVQLSLAIVVCSHLFQYGLITSLWLQQGTPFYGPSFDIANVIRAEHLQGQPLWLQTNHLAYWLTDSPPITPAVAHPSNITKPLLLQAWYGKNASSLTELEKIVNRQPALIVSNEQKGGISTYFRSSPEAQALLEATIRQDYQVLASPYPELKFYRHRGFPLKANKFNGLWHLKVAGLNRITGSDPP